MTNSMNAQLELANPQQETYTVYLVLKSMMGDHPAELFLDKEEESRYVMETRGGSCTFSTYSIHHLGGLAYALDFFNIGLEEGKSPNDTYLYGQEEGGVLYWHFTVDSNECSIRFTSLVDALEQLDKRIEELDDEMQNEYYANDYYEQEGPYGGAFIDEIDFARHVGIDMKYS